MSLAPSVTVTSAEVVATLSDNVIEASLSASVIAVTLSAQQGPAGGAGIPGPPGPPGASGSAGDTFAFVQSSPASTWVITHNLGRFPSVTVIDSANSEVEGDVVYLDANHIAASFSAPFSGTAYLN